MSAKQKLSPLRSRGWFFLCLLPAFLSACLPIPARADSLEDAARTLARKVASQHSKYQLTDYSWQNYSVLPSNISERMRKAFEEELERQHIHLESQYGSNFQIRLTDGPSRIFLIAAISGEETHMLAFVSSPKGQYSGTERLADVLKLGAQLLWEQQEPFLDVAQMEYSTGKPELLLVLGKTVLSLYGRNEKGWILKDSALLPQNQAPMRDQRGEIHLTDHFFQFHLPGMECDGDAFLKLAFECEESKGIWRSEFDPMLPFTLEQGNNFFAVDPHYIGPKKLPLKGFFSAAVPYRTISDFQDQTTIAGGDGRTYVYSHGKEIENDAVSLERSPVEWGSDLISTQPDCLEGSIVLASGAHDHTSADLLQGFQLNGRSATAVTSILEFSGPILSLRDDGDPGPIAVVLNLTTGNYEAYRVTVACGN